MVSWSMASPQRATCAKSPCPRWTKPSQRRGDLERISEVKYAPFVVTGTTEEEMARSATEVRERIAFYASTPAYRPVLEIHGWGDLQGELNTLARKGDWKTMGTLIDDDVLGAFRVAEPDPYAADGPGHVGGGAGGPDELHSPRERGSRTDPSHAARDPDGCRLADMKRERGSSPLSPCETPDL